MSVTMIFAALIPVLIFAGIVMALQKKDNRKTEETMTQMSDADISRLKDVKIYSAEGKPDCWIQEMMIVSAKDKGSKMGIRALYYNMTITNNTYQTMCPADFKMPKDEYIKDGLDTGSFIYVFVDPEKAVVKYVPEKPEGEPLTMKSVYRETSV